jgi:signal peptidase I
VFRSLYKVEQIEMKDEEIKEKKIQPEAPKEEGKKREKSGFREFFELIAETAVFVFFVMTFVVQAFQIPTGSMEPTLLVGDFLLVNKFAYSDPVLPLEGLLVPRKKIERGDVVVFKYPQDLEKDFVKRVIALEGEKIEVRKKQVYINDEPILEDYKIHMIGQYKDQEDNYYYYNDTIKENYGPVVVPPGQCFVMGDNRDNSFDSRYWRFLPVNNIKGRPWIIYFSYRAERDAYKKTSFRERLKKFVSFVLKARLSRVLKVIK